MQSKELPLSPLSLPPSLVRYLPHYTREEKIEKKERLPPAVIVVGLQQRLQRQQINIWSCDQLTYMHTYIGTHDYANVSTYQ